MTESTPEPQASADPAAGDDDVTESAEMKLDSAEVDHIELSQDGGETFERKSDEEHFG